MENARLGIEELAALADEPEDVFEQEAALHMSVLDNVFVSLLTNRDYPGIQAKTGPAMVNLLIGMSDFFRKPLATDKFFGRTLFNINQLFGYRNIENAKPVGLQLVRENLPAIQSHAFSDNVSDRINCVEAFANVSAHSKDETEQLFAYTQLEPHFPFVRDQITSQRISSSNLLILSSIAASGQGKYSAEAKRMLEHYVAALGTPEQDKDFYIGISTVEHPFMRTLTESAVSTTFEKFGLCEDDILEAWKLGAPEEDDGIATHYPKMVALEYRNRGINQRLFDEFGIANCSQYPEFMLERQFEQAMERDERAEEGTRRIPHLAIFNAQYEYNIDTGVDPFFEQVASQLHPHIEVKIYEIKSKLDAIRKLNSMRKRYGRAQGIIALGHGNAGLWRMGEGDKGAIRNADLKRKGAGAISLALAQYAPFISSGCENGVEGGPIQALSAVIDGDVYGSLEVAHLDALTIEQLESKKGGYLDFNPLFKKPVGFFNTKVSSHSHYRNGELVAKYNE